MGDGARVEPAVKADLVATLDRAREIVVASQAATRMLRELVAAVAGDPQLDEIIGELSGDQRDRLADLIEEHGVAAHERHFGGRVTVVDEAVRELAAALGIESRPTTPAAPSPPPATTPTTSSPKPSNSVG